MTSSVSAQEAVANIGHYLQRAAAGKERFLVIAENRPLAAVVSVEDYERLEALDRVNDVHPTMAEQEAAFRQALEAAGMVVRWPSEAEGPLSERVPLPIKGPPLSQQIIEERR